MAQAQSRKLSLVTNSDIVSLAEIEDAYFEGEFTMSTAREEMREGFIRLEMGLEATNKRLASVETQLAEAAGNLKKVNEERTALKAIGRFAAWAVGIIGGAVAAAWSLFTHFTEK